MAKLSVPVKAYAWKSDKITAKGKIVIADKPNKFHLEASRHSESYQWMVITVCGKTIQIQDDHTVIENVADLQADQICQICLGAMTAED